MSKTVKAKGEKKNVGTQTREIDTMLEIARLQEQVKLLTIENDHLRKYTIENPSTILTSVIPSTSPNNIDNTPKHNETIKNSLQNQSTQRKSNKVAARGCTCKGKCSSKICGCVKKDIQCGELCKCNSGVCKNQEQKNTDQDKENVYDNELTRKHMVNQQIVNKHLADVNMHKSLFSPDIQGSTPNEEQFRSESLYFGSPKVLTFGSDEEEKEENKDEKMQKTSMKNNKNDQNSVTQRKGRTKKNNLEVNKSEYVRKLRSSSNEEKRTQNDLKIENHALRKCTSNEIQVNKEIEEMEKRTNHYIQNIMHGMVSLRRGQKESKNKLEERTISNVTDLNKETNPVSLKDNAKGIPDDITNEIPKSSKQKKMEPDRRETHDKNESFNTIEDCDGDFNPMKPKRELPRTPVSDNNQTISRNISDTSLITSINIEDEEFQIPEELTQPQVNWEEYQSQLVACDKCKRKFHPFRIKKHRSCCKKV